MPPEEKKDWKPEKFPQPRAYPAEWNMSGLMTASEESAVREDTSDWKPETFPQPRTFPKNWHFDNKNQ